MHKLLLILFIAMPCYAKTIKIALIDTGIDINNKTLKVCSEGSKDFTESKEGYKDTHGHGTHIASIIQEYAGNGDYCFVVLKYYLDSATGAENLLRSNEAFKYAFDLKVDYINYSGGGPIPSDIERLLIKKHPKTIIVAALGNDKKDLNKYCEYFPACYNYPNVIRVGNMNKRGTRQASSNTYSKADYWAMGENVKAIALNNKPAYFSGTSQATAKVTGLLIKRLRSKQVDNGLTYKGDGLFYQTLDIVECKKWHDRCNDIGK